MVEGEGVVEDESEVRGLEVDTFEAVCVPADWVAECPEVRAPALVEVWTGLEAMVARHKQADEMLLDEFLHMELHAGNPAVAV